MNLPMQPKKRFPLSDWAINNSSTVFVIIAIILVGGISAFVTLPREDFPEIIENKVYISTVFPGNPSEDVEKLVTIPIEDEIRNIKGIQDVKSTSFDDYGMIIIEFSDDVKLDQAKLDVKDAIDVVKSDSDWPTLDTGGKVEPSVFDLNIAEEQPILNLNFTGDYDEQELKEFAEHLQDKIEELPEIKAADIRGVDDEELEVAVDIYRMASAGVSFNDVINAIGSDNRTISGGKIINQDHRANIRVIGEIENPNDLRFMAVKNQGGTVYLGDIADILFHEKDKTTYARDYGKPVVMLDVKKRSGQNMIEAVEQIKEIVQNEKENYYPENLNINITNDQAPRTENQVNDLVNNIVFGVILVVGVLMFFLGLKNASFVGAAIPLSMLMSLIIVQLMGLTMNTMVLFALVMGLGMLVDNGIVVVENVFTLMSNGYDRKTAAKQGVGEIAWPIIASTLTTLAAFFPLALWPGTMGKFMKYFPITLSFVLLSSLFVALVINAMLTSKYMSVEKEESIPQKKLIRRTIIYVLVGGVFIALGFATDREFLRLIGNFFVITAMMLWVYDYALLPINNWFQEKGLPFLEDKYEKALIWFLAGRRPSLTLIGMFVLLILSFVLVGVAQPKVLFFPETFPNQIITYIEYPEGTDIEKTNELTKKVEQQIIDIMDQFEVEKDGKPYNYMVESIISQVGTGAGNPQVDAGNNSETPHKGKVTVSLREFKYRRGINSKELLQEVRNAIPSYPGASIQVESEPVGPPAGYPVNIELQGENYDEILSEAQRMIAFIDDADVKGLEGLNTDVSKENAEIQLDIDETKAGALGVTTAAVGQTLRQSIYGWEASRFKPKGDEDDYPINVRLNPDQRYNEDLLFNQPVTFRNQATGQLMQVPISTVATAKKTQQFSQIKRDNFKRTITVYSNVLKEDGFNANEVVANIKTKLESGFEPKKGIRYAFTGEQEEQAKQMAFLGKALILGIVGILMIIVLQFNSISKPIIIMTAVLLSFIGVFLGLVFTGSEFVILMTMMGIISLAGIVVNNAIVLIDYTDLLVQGKKDELDLQEDEPLSFNDYKNAIIMGGKSRLRPVLLTAITTVLGLVPLAIGINIDFYSLLVDFNPHIYIGGDNLAFWGPLAKTVIYGLTFATFLTLVIVPVMLLINYKIKMRVQGRKTYNLGEQMDS